MPISLSTVKCFRDDLPHFVTSQRGTLTDLTLSNIVKISKDYRGPQVCWVEILQELRHRLDLNKFALRGVVGNGLSLLRRLKIFDYQDCTKRLVEQCVLHSVMRTLCSHLILPRVRHVGLDMIQWVPMSLSTKQMNRSRFLSPSDKSQL